MTAAERLLQLAGTTGTAAALLMAIGAGSTAGEALANYSGLLVGSASVHLLAERNAEIIGSAWMPAPDRFNPRKKPRDEDAAILLAVLH